MARETLSQIAVRSERAASSAAGIARSFSRWLRAAGLLMANTSDKYRWTEGLHVHRVGCSGSVSVRYHVPYHGTDTVSTARAREAMDKARAILAAKGYMLDSRGWFTVATK